MTSPTEQLQGILQTEQLDTLLYRGKTPLENTLPYVYGGQVMAQSLNAAMRTVPEDRMMHSMHAYFLRSGDVKHPIIFEVDPIRDGGSFTTRHVLAKQHDKAIFNMSVSFKISEQGLEHSYPIPEVPAPETLQDDVARYKRAQEENPELRRPLSLPNQPDAFQCFDIRTVSDFPSMSVERQSSTQGFWFKLKYKLEADVSMHQTFLAFISDLRLLRPSYLAHGFSDRDYSNKIVVASLDHSLWIHNQFDINDWHYYHTNSPVTSRGCGLSFGQFYSRSGKLVASSTQESLLRLK
ncbi:MAG: acyl-CoA thioesterase II [Gammaproteobacteria bacterium]|nr:acyl-CoA thioesterase II [Gammaproteobacteria bacterium]